jgi:hypothetical protein
MLIEFDVSCDASEFEDGRAAVAVKLSSAIVEANVWFPYAEARELHKVLELTPDAPALPLGRSAGSQAFWARGEEDQFFLLVGEGETTWDIGITLPALVVRRIVQDVAAERLGKD